MCYIPSILDVSHYRLEYKTHTSEMFCNVMFSVTEQGDLRLKGYWLVCWSCRHIWAHAPLCSTVRWVLGNRFLGKICQNMKLYCVLLYSFIVRLLCATVRVCSSVLLVLLLLLLLLLVWKLYKFQLKFVGCYVMLRYVVLCYIMLWYVMLCYVRSHSGGSELPGCCLHTDVYRYIYIYIYIYMHSLREQICDILWENESHLQVAVCVFCCCRLW